MHNQVDLELSSLSLRNKVEILKIAECLQDSALANISNISIPNLKQLVCLQKAKLPALFSGVDPHGFLTIKIPTKIGFNLNKQVPVEKLNYNDFKQIAFNRSNFNFTSDRLFWESLVSHLYSVELSSETL